MRFLVLDSYYSEPLQLVYRNNPGLENKTYEEQLQAIYDFGFARSDSLPRNLRLLGQEADQIIVNAFPLQQQWAKEHGLRLPSIAPRDFFTKLAYLPLHLYRALGRRLGFFRNDQENSWQTRIVAAQVDLIDPDVILICDVLQFAPQFLWQIKGKRRLLIGECGYPIPPAIDLRPYDLVVSCVPHYVDNFRQAGARAELWRHGFDPSILERLHPGPKTEAVIFLGSFTNAQRYRAELVEAIGECLPIRCWGTWAENLLPESNMRKRIQNPLWGYDMYRKLQEARVILNVHGEVAENFAGNMRLFEATGVGSLLVTDWKQNLPDIFLPGTEVIAYRTLEECVELIQYYLEHDNECEAISHAGQERTLREHTYYHRVQELLHLVRSHLSQ
jgi:hypothetical protein